MALVGQGPEDPLADVVGAEVGGVFGDRLLVDGGLVNPLPYDVIMDACDLTIAVDVQGSIVPRKGEAPTYFETTFNSMQIMAATLTRAQLDARPPDIYLKPDIKDVRVLDFYRFEEIYRQTQPAKAALKRELQRLAAEMAADEPDGFVHEEIGELLLGDWVVTEIEDHPEFHRIWLESDSGRTGLEVTYPDPRVHDLDEISETYPSRMNERIIVQPAPGEDPPEALLDELADRIERHVVTADPTLGIPF